MQRSAMDRRLDAWLGIIVAELGMALSLFGEHITRYTGWLVPGDVWVAVRASQYVADGAFPYLYEARHPGPLASLPLLPILEAPLYALGRSHGATESLISILPFPTMWLYVAPVGLVSIPVLFIGIGQLAPLVGISAVRVLQALSVALVCAPVGVFGHFEDLWMAGLVMLASSAALEGRLRRSALHLGVAMAFKQSAVLVLPLFAAAWYRSSWPRRSVEALALPGFLGGVPLLLDWTHAAPALLALPTFPGGGRRTPPWVDDQLQEIAASPYRLVLIVVVALLVWAVNRNRTPGAVLAAAGLALLSRPLVEPVLHHYYLAPGVLFALLCAARHSAVRLALATASAAVPFLLFAWHPESRVVWWVALNAAVLAVMVPLLIDVFSRGDYGRSSSRFRGPGQRSRTSGRSILAGDGQEGVDPFRVAHNEPRSS